MTTEGIYTEPVEAFLGEWNNSSTTLLVHTSGSTGKPKAMMVEKQRMLNSARITCDFLGLKSGDTALLCMPLEYIAGKMMVVRGIERGLRLYSVKPSNHPLAETDTDFDFAAMVPSQVFCSLQVPEEKRKLARIKHLIIGGGAISNELQTALCDLFSKEKQSEALGKVYSTYGMTETLSHIALRELTGPNASEWYTPFPSVTLSLEDYLPMEVSVPQEMMGLEGNVKTIEGGGRGCLVINAPLVHDGELHTNDIAEIANDGRRFRIIGRRDNVICSGGIKLQAEEIEEALRPYMTAPYAITKRPDEKFGEIVVLLMEQTDIPPLHLDNPYFMPKEFIHVDSIPMTETGKIKRKALLSFATATEPSSVVHRG